MKRPTRNKLIDAAVIFISVLIVLAVALGRNGSIGKTNRAKREVKEAFLAGQYPKAYQDGKLLTDSLHVGAPAAWVNRAHAGYLVARNSLRDPAFIDLYKSDTTSRASADTTDGQKTTTGILRDAFTVYTALGDSTIASEVGTEALNQLGVITVRMSGARGADEESILRDAAAYFKRALQKDPQNDFARFNYELVTKKIQYPERLAQQLNALVNSRKYKEARTLLRNAVKYDQRIQKKYAEHLKRIETIISIDSLSRS